MRTMIAALVVCACTTSTLAGGLIVEPDQFRLTGSTLHMFGGNVQHQSGGTGSPSFRPGIVEARHTVNDQGQLPSSENWTRIDYLVFGDVPVVPPPLTDRIFIGSRAITRSGNSSTGADRFASIESTFLTQFYLTETATADLSGFFNLGLSDIESGGNRYATARITLVRLCGDDLPQFIYGLNETNEDIPSTVDWTETLEPGHYAFSVDLMSYAGASAPGVSAVSNISTNLELSFTAIPAPTSTGLVGVLGLFAARRRR